MKKTVLNKNERLLAYSAMAAAMVAAIPDANADIVYVDIPDVTLELGDFTTAEFDGDGVVDFAFGLSSGNSGDWTFIRAFGSISFLTYGNATNMFIGYSGAILPYGSALGSGALIGPDASFVEGLYNQVFMASIYSGITYGQFGDAEDHYLGFKFDIGGELHYGWIRVNCTVGPVTLTVRDWAYDDEANTPIIAGATATPLPVANFEGDAIIVDETAASTTVTVMLDIAGDCSVDLDVNDALTTATNGVDFTMSDPTVATFAGGVTTLSFDITLTDDLDFEGTESIVIDINNPVGCEIGAASQYAIVIDDNEVPLPALVNMDGTAVALSESGGSGSVGINISETSDCVVEYALNAGGTTATEGSDFTYTTGSVTFVDGGALTQSFDYTIIDDVEVESTEDIIFEITGVTGTCAIGLITESSVAIIDNDVAPVVGEVSLTEVAGTVEEIATTFTGTVEMDEASDCTVTLNVNAGASTATNGEDFTFSETILTFTEGGATTQTFDVTINADVEIEPDETVVVEITSIDGSCTLDETADALSLVIVNNDFIDIHEFSNAGIQLYTFNNQVMLQFENASSADGAGFQLLDATGRIVFDASNLVSENTFTLNTLPTGVYVARVVINGKALDKQVYLNN